MDVSPVRLPIEASVSDAQSPVRPSQARSSGSGNSPVRAIPQPQNSPTAPSSVQDEVKVQWDGSVHLRIYQFVKQPSGVLILQVPSEEVLNVTRGIQESFREETAQRQAATFDTGGNEGEKKNGG